MTRFHVSLVSPESLLFSGQVDQVDLPGIEGDLGILAGHAPIVVMLRPGIVTAVAGNISERFVIFGGIAEFSQEKLTILADSASSVDGFDLAGLKSQIDEMQENIAKQSVGNELDRAIAKLDHFKAIHTALVQATAF
jgi:F-type H+-transporting ATPase subunit epsilon